MAGKLSQIVGTVLYGTVWYLFHIYDIDMSTSTVPYRSRYEYSSRARRYRMLVAIRVRYGTVVSDYFERVANIHIAIFRRRGRRGDEI